MGGIGYTDVYPPGRTLRDSGLGMIRTGTSKVMNLLIQREECSQVLGPAYVRRVLPADAMNPDNSEWCFGSVEMQLGFGDVT
jgi:hypothetical protein